LKLAIYNYKLKCQEPRFKFGQKNLRHNLIIHISNIQRKGYQWEGIGYKERVKEAECNENIMYKNGKTRTTETILGIGRGE
jgi:hypothetical protein